MGEFSRKLELLNTYMEQEMVAWNHEQQVRFNHPNQLYCESKTTNNCHKVLNQLIEMAAGLSEDSDYTSDISYPIQQNPSFTSHHPNSSTSHFGGASNLTRRAIETNYNPNNFESFSRDESIGYQNQSNFESNQQNLFVGSRDQFKGAYNEEFSEPLSYNSRPPRRALPQINADK